MRSRDEIDVLRAAFEVARAMTVGIEEELMILEPETLNLTPRAPDVLALVVLPAVLLDAGDGWSAAGGAVWAPAVVVADER